MNSTKRTNQSRKGVTLLFTISMIVLFLLMGTTFVVVANDYFKSANRRTQLSTYEVNATELLDRAFDDVLRGPSLSDESSSLRGHSILEDQYGYGYTTTIDSATTGPIASLQTLVISGDITSMLDGSTLTVTDEPDGFLGGCVLTFSSGPAAGYSSRIVSSFLDMATGNLRLVIPTDELGIPWGSVIDAPVVINGRDFSGQGVGTGTAGGLDSLDFDTASVTSSQITGGVVAANQIGKELSDLIADYITSENSTNEPFDVADENNWFLAGEDIDGFPIPSFHRDRIYEQGLMTIGRTPDDIRSFSFRPVFIDGEELDSNAQRSSSGTTSRFGEFHEQDDTAIPAMHMAGDLVNSRNNVNGLDVDSDGDGTNDAVWIDIGLPVQTDADGRQFKPLVAYRIVDMDSRLNLNVHGSYADQALGAGTRRGSSFGVAEVSLRGLGSYGSLLNMRSADTVPGHPLNALRAENQTLFAYPGHSLKTGGLFASGADVFGINTVGRDTSVYGGDAINGFTTSAALTGASTQTVPYAADLGIGGGIGDSLFQASELEALLRSNDIDAGLVPSRLEGISSLVTNKDAITTDSSEIAMPPFSIVERLWDEVGSDRTIYRELIARSYLSEEMLMGGLYDLNQPTGNGIDDDGNGVVDDSVELGTVAQDSPRQDGQPFDLNNAGDGITGDSLAKQRKANQLYILALLTTGDTAPGFTGMSTANYRRAVAQWAVNVVDFTDTDSIMTAFEYDIDPFNDVYPDGNPITDDESARTMEGSIVFGAERPEILITENSCSHDRRNRDLDTDNGDSELVGTDPGDDDDWDSSHFPESSVFIELYNPWTQIDPRNAARLGVTTQDAAQILPAELYAEQTRGSDLHYGVDLTRTVTDSGGLQSPVWRIGVKRERSDATFLRAVFFTNMTDPINDGELELETLVTGDNFFPNYQNAAGSASVTPYVVDPGTHFVLGSSGNVDGEFRVTFGRPSSNMPDVANTRSIGLLNASAASGVTIRDPGATPPVSSVECGVAAVNHFVTYDGTMITTTPTERSLSFSDPDEGYDPLVPDAIEIPETDGTRIEPPLDQPLDSIPGGRNDADLAMIWNNGVSDNFRVIHLQRLADPTRPYNSLHNPYITIDTAEVDLLAFNGLNNDPNNTDTNEVRQDPAGGGAVLNVTSSPTALTSSERGENRQNLGVTRNGDHIASARRTFFRTGEYRRDGNYVDTNTGQNNGGDLHNFSFGFTDMSTRLISLGERNNSIGGAAGDASPLGELVWLNRPFANAMELAHVPLMPNGGQDGMDPTSRTLLDYFNLCRSIDDIPAATGTTPAPTAQEQFAYYFADDKFGHLMGFGGMSPASGGTAESNGDRLTDMVMAMDVTPVRRMANQANRFDVIFDFVNVPSKFQGLRKWLAGTAGFTATPAAPAGGMFFNLRAPFNSLPSFREPGKINLNTMFEDQNNPGESLVFRGITGKSSSTSTDGFSSLTDTYDEFRDLRNTNIEDPMDTSIIDNATTDFQNLFLPVSRAQFTSENPRSGNAAGLFRRIADTPGATSTPELRTFDRVQTSDTNSNTNVSSWYENEFRQRLGSVATTRSSVFSVWVTIGYFEVDQFGRLGDEIGSEEGQVRRNRAFYMVDRSIPVACEPGKNHNVDQAVLVRTIIE